MDVELRDRVGLADQTEELAFGRLQRGVRHHVQEADMEFADLLVRSAVGRQHRDAVLAQALEGGQGIVRYQRHLSFPCARPRFR